VKPESWHKIQHHMRASATKCIPTSLDITDLDYALHVVILRDWMHQRLCNWMHCQLLQQVHIKPIEWLQCPARTLTMCCMWSPSMLAESQTETTDSPHAA
jgi:hypothetical protein